MAYAFKKTVSPERLRQLLDYDADTGIFTWKIDASTRRRAGSIAGYANSAGYISIAVDKSYFMAHRLAWLHIHGCWPPDEIDHINRVRSDNRLANLRVVNRSINTRNNGGLGYSVNKYGRFVASLTLNRRSVYLGTFERAEDARSAYLTARQAILSELSSCAQLVDDKGRVKAD